MSTKKLQIIEATGFQSDWASTDEASINFIKNKPNIIDMIYPVGSIYMSVNDANPQLIFGGTWEQIKDTFLLGAGDSYLAGSVGGEAEHILTIDEMPSHMHDITNKEGLGDKGLCGANDLDGTNGYNWSFADTSNDETNNKSGLFKAASTGGGLSHNNMPPYLVVNMWQRIE